MDSEVVDGVVEKIDVHDDVGHDASDGEMGERVRTSVDFEGLSVSIPRSGSKGELMGDE